MRKLLMAAAAIMLMMATMALTSCTNDDDNPVTPPESKQLAEYTIMYYGHGGGNLDRFDIQSIGKFYEADPDAFKKVNVVAQYKFSTTENMLEQEYWTVQNCEAFGSMTFRWAVDPAQEVLGQMDAEVSLYGLDNADLACPDSLTNFINWAARTYPAKKYLLILSDHGGGYQPNDELPENKSTTTRGLIYDDGNYENGFKRHFTAKSLHRAIATANVHIETIVMDACLMNCLEYQFELQDVCNYVIASTFSMPAKGGAYNVLAEQLSQPLVDIEQALSTYCKAYVDSWNEGLHIDETTPKYNDLTLTRTANIAHLGEVLREFTDRLCDTYTNGTDAQKQAIDSCTASTMKIEKTIPSYDAVRYMKSIVNALPEVYGEEFYNRMKEAFNNCIVAQYFSKYLTAHDFMVDYSVLLGTLGTYSYIYWKTDPQTNSLVPFFQEVFSPDGEHQGLYLYPTESPYYYRMEPYGGDPLSWGSTLADTYEQLEFDRAVGWSRWLRLNRQWPNLFCPKDLKFELPIPDAGDIQY